MAAAGLWRPGVPDYLGIVTAPICIVGLGQLGTVFAEGFLKLGRPVIPVLRGQRIDDALKLAGCPEPALVVIAVGEDDLGPALASLPKTMHDRVVLLQNELRPGQWHQAGITEPTIAIVWFEKKSTSVVKEVRPSVVAGPHRALVSDALIKVGVKSIDKGESVASAEVAHELVLKNLYILGLNLTGLSVGGTAGQLLGVHRPDFQKVIDEIFELESSLLDSDDSTLTRGDLNKARLHQELENAIVSDPGHGTSGRSAQRRLERSLDHSRTVGAKLIHLEDLGRRLLKP